MSDDDGPRLADTTAFTVIGLGRLLQRRLEAALSSEGVTLRHLGALGHLRARPGMSVSELARRAGVTVQSMHQTIAALVERGAIDPGAQTRQGRAARLTITAEGRRLLAAAADAAAALDATVLAVLPVGSADALRRAAAGLFGADGTATAGGDQGTDGPVGKPSDRRAGGRGLPRR